jgi:hypothetical protein
MVIHFHALLASQSQDLNVYLLRKPASALWKEMAGFARIERVRSSGDALRYLTKYVSKGGEIDVSKNLRFAGATAL